MKKSILMILPALLLLCGCGKAEMKQLKQTAVYPHDPSSFTQGLSFSGGKLYESTGLYGESMIYMGVDLQTGKPEHQGMLPKELFGEGSVVFHGTLYLLTWQENQVLTFDPETLDFKQVYAYDREGWGLTTDGEQLIASDGSSSLYSMDENLNTLRVLTVTRDGEPVVNLNELEYIDGVIWANVWFTDEIVRIDMKSGKVIQTFHMQEILPKEAFPEDHNSVLNGIAWNPETKKLYLTGKHWPELYEFEIM